MQRTAITVPTKLRDKIRIATAKIIAAGGDNLTMGQWLERAVNAQAEREEKARRKQKED